MKVLKFNLSGKTAFFKVHEVNSVCYFTYGNIHKPALLGMFGAIMGYEGYGQQNGVFPEYYSRLKDLQVSIVPGPEDGYFNKKVQVFNNSVGYASNEQGGNLIVKEQWLENPEWNIYLKVDNEESARLAEKIIDGRCIFMPYLGKNDHSATISNAKYIEMDEINPKEETIRCIMPLKWVDFDFEEMTYRYDEYLPMSLSEQTNHYVQERFVLTDASVVECRTQVYKDEGSNIVFY